MFHPKTDPEPYLNQYLAAVKTELAWYGERWSHRLVTSIFLGGGTPSQLTLAQISDLLGAVRRHFELDPDCEISMELNPEDATPAYLNGLPHTGVTRISFGVQTFNDQGLKAIGRIHNGDRALEALRTAPAFPHGRSLDLILGLPHQTPAVLDRDLALTADLDMEHVALYMLERDLPTPLDKTVSQNLIPNEDAQAAYYDTVRDFLGARGYRHYEISNFAKPGYQCRHNLTYWRMGDYLGLGPAAHGRVGAIYTANHPQLKDYLEGLRITGCGVEHRERWTEERLNQERIIQGLRLSEGVPMNLLNEHHLAQLTAMENYGLVRYQDNRLQLTEKGRLLGNEVFEIFT